MAARRGRKRMDPQERRGVKVSTMIRSCVEQKILEVSEQKDITFGSLINEILENWASAND